MSTRLRVLTFLTRYPCASIPEIRKDLGEHLGYKRVAAIVEKLKHEELIVDVCKIDRRFYYAPTPKGARLVGADDRRYRGWPGPAVIAERITVMLACIARGWELQTATEVRTHYKQLAKCPGVSSARYAIDFAAETPVIYYVLPGHTTRSARVAYKARKQWEERRKFGAFDRYIYHPSGLFRLAIIVGADSKAESIRRALGPVPFTPEFVIVPELIGLFSSNNGGKE